MSAKRIANFKYVPRQRGAALLILLVILIVGIAAVLLNSLTSSSANTARQAMTAAALAQAKEALIGFALSYGDTHSGQVHGYLPCPDTAGGNPEGSAEPSCGSQDVSIIGRLPWATLDLSTLRDGDGECLWYAVSGTYKDNPKTGLMNWDTNGQLQAYASDGSLLTPADNQVVAVIFAPGAPQSGQDRTGTTAPVCGGNYTAANYLDSNNDMVHNINNAAIATGQFIQGASGSNVNDQLIFITRQDIWNAIQKRTDFQNTLKQLTQQVALCLANYGNNNGGSSYWPNKSLPWPAPVAFPAGSDYSINSNYNDSVNLFAGRVPYDVGTSTATMSNAYGTLMAACTGISPSTWTNLAPWWNNWKDHLFYALGEEYKPVSTYHNTTPCGQCLSINGAGNYAAVVMFANSRLGSLATPQVRISNTISTSPISTKRGDINNYLEDNNASNFPGANGNENYKTAIAGSTFNDVLYCIRANTSTPLTVIPCP